MYHHLFTVFFMLPLLECGGSIHLEERSGHRIKRIINGQPLEDYHTPYSVTRYSVFIANPSSCAFFESFHNFLLAISFVNTYNSYHGWKSCDGIDPDDEMCSGALLTPRIVQTACHCLAYEIHTSDEWWRYTVLDSFSDKLLCFVGSTVTDEMKKGYFSKRFIIHHNCAVNALTKETYYDHGLIVLQTAVSVGTKSYILDFAPLYKEETIAYLHNKLISEEPVCLFAGFGVAMDGKYLRSPKIMQHTWRTIKSYTYCATMRHAMKLSVNITWFCHLTLPGKGGKTGQGDSGSPVTCNNQYIAIHSFATKYFILLGGAYSLYYSPWENAAEYRREFTERTYELADGDKG